MSLQLDKKAWRAAVLAEARRMGYTGKRPFTAKQWVEEWEAYQASHVGSRRKRGGQRKPGPARAPGPPRAVRAPGTAGPGSYVKWRAGFINNWKKVWGAGPTPAVVSAAWQARKEGVGLSNIPKGRAIPRLDLSGVSYRPSGLDAYPPVPKAKALVAQTPADLIELEEVQLGRKMEPWPEDERQKFERDFRRHWARINPGLGGPWSRDVEAAWQKAQRTKGGVEYIG